jgi:peptidyl-tRNA hydrolase
MKTQTLKPGLLVALSVRMSGGITYDRVDISEVSEGGTLIRKWQTTSTIIDQAEYEAAGKRRDDIRGIIKKCCLQTAFGLICTLDKQPQLEAAIDQARAEAAGWNATASYNKIAVDVLPAIIARDSEAAAKAITSEVRDLLQEMRTAVQAAAPDEIKKACTKAKAIGQMLSESLQEDVDKAIAQARSIARRIVQRVEKEGAKAAEVLAECNTAAIDQARFTFLQLAPEDAPALDSGDTMPAADPQQFADLDTGLEGLLFAPMPEQAPEAPILDDGEQDAPELDYGMEDEVMAIDADEEAA